MYNQGVFNRAHLSGAGTTNISTAAQFLHSVNVNTAGTTVTVADTIGTIAVIGAVTGSFIFDTRLQGTLSVTIAGAADVTVTYL